MTAVSQDPQLTAPDVPEQPGEQALLRASAGQKLTNGEERTALDYLLGPTKPIEYDVAVKLETEGGLMPMTFHVKQMDAKRFDEIDAANRSGDGPFSKLDVQGFNAQVLAEATVYMTDPSGRRVSPNDPDWLGGVPTPPLAMALRFKYQPGLLDALVDQLRAVSGYSAERVGTAQRALVESGKP